MCILLVCMCYASEALEICARTRGSTTPMRSSAGAIIEKKKFTKCNRDNNINREKKIEWHLFGLSLMLLCYCATLQKNNIHFDWNVSLIK